MLPGSSPAGAKSIKICGHDVFFPDGITPFSSQKSVISKALIAMNNGENALLESPTGTGKTLALLTSTLSWQKKQYKLDMKHFTDQQSRDHRRKSYDAKQEGTPSRLPSTPQTPVDACSSPRIRQSTDCDSLSAASSATPKAPKAPRPKQIFFCARTHSQLQQVWSSQQSVLG